MKEWGQQEQTETGALTDHGSARLQAKLREFLWESFEKGKKQQGEDKTQANVASLVAFDHSLQASVGFGLERFVPHRRPRPLGLGDVRFYVNREDLPEDVQVGVDRDRRSCIDALGEVSFLEVVWGPRPTMQVHLDQADKQWPGRTWLFTEVPAKCLRCVSLWPQA